MAPVAAARAPFMDYVSVRPMAVIAAELPTSCLGEDMLCAFAEGCLDATEAARVEEHLAGCPACGELVTHAMESTGIRPSTRHPASLPAPDEAQRLAVGTRVARYVVQEPVGAGAMSTVYAAHDPELDRRVALKLLRPGPEGGDKLRARLYREAKAMARLSHPHVITVYDVGAYGSQLFVAMELVPGGTMRGWLASAARPWRDVVDKYVQAGRGLACAHAAGLVHRDFKPDNVLVGSDGRVRVTDFGLARAAMLDDDASMPPLLGADLVTTITRTGALVGTPAYMAPEQLRGEPTDARADMFGFCVALYEALYGERPFTGRDVLALRASTAAGAVRPAPRASPVLAGLRSALLPGLRPRPADRYGSMEDLLEELEGAVRAAGVEPSELAATAARTDRRPSGAWTTRRVAAALGLVCAAALGGRALLVGPPETAAATPERPAPLEHTVLDRAVGTLPVVPVEDVAGSPRVRPVVPRSTGQATARVPVPPPPASVAPVAPPTPASLGAPLAAAAPTGSAASSLAGAATHDRE